MPTLDYIRIIGIEDITYDDPEKTDITYKIEHSEEADFEESNRGIITFRISEWIDTEGFDNNDIDKIARKLIKQVLIREKDDDGGVYILHMFGLPIEQWVLNNLDLLNQ